MCEVDLSPARILRYFTKVIVGHDDECWPWTGGIDRKGYAQFRVAPGKMSKGHIFSYVLHHGPVPPGKQVDHECVTPGCQNPKHLRALTNIENNAISTSPSAINARKIRCIRGHLFDEENTRIRPDGARACRACEREREVRRSEAA